MITTIYGDMDESQLKRVDILEEDNDDYKKVATEYWQLVHRSVTVDLKKGLALFDEQGKING